MDMFGMGHHGSITVGGKEQAPYGELQILTKQVFAVFVCLTWMKSQSTEGAFGCDTTLPFMYRSGRYVINYSQCPSKDSPGAGGQNITFAESFDLIHWSQPAPFNTTYFDIDTTNYKVVAWNPSNACPHASFNLSPHQFPGRWDCIYSIPTPNATGGNGLRDGYPRYGYWTATPIEGTMGFGITHDGSVNGLQLDSLRFATHSRPLQMELASTPVAKGDCI